MVLLNSKAGDLVIYSLPRSSVLNWEEVQIATFNNSSQSKKCQRYESSNRNGPDLSNKPKVKFKTPCLNVEAKMKLGKRSNKIGPGK